MPAVISQVGLDYEVETLHVFYPDTSKVVGREHNIPQLDLDGGDDNRTWHWPEKVGE